MTEKEYTMVKKLKRRLAAKIGKSYFVRFHMFMILSATILSGVVYSKILVLSGVTRMPLRYGLAIVLSYLMFFLFIKLWLFYIGVGRSTRLQIDNKGGSSWTTDVLPLPDGSISDAGDAGIFSGFRGGASGGSGAVRSFAAPMQGVADAGTGPGSIADAAGSTGDAAGSILDAVDDSVLTVIAIILLITLVLSIFIVGGYLIWCAPTILSDTAFHALLVAGFARKVRQAEETNWETTIFKATWWAFLLVLVFSIAFGIVAQMVCPNAVTIRDVITFLLAA
jgi:hypothetical protein